MKQLTKILLEDYARGREIDPRGIQCNVTPDAVRRLLTRLRILLFPGHFGETAPCGGMASYIAMVVSETMYCLQSLICPLADVDCAAFLRMLPEIRQALELDLQAFLAADPAARDGTEIIMAYPGFYAIGVQRLAHVLYELGVPVLPRMMTELAHSDTGIDIHPGAVLGPSFFIDHGTGVVIGETTVTGAGVKIYQGVTLGALSTRNAPALRGIKRHPTLEDGVTVYAGASILGGDTVVGAGAVIGANAFVTGSVEPGVTVIGHRPGP